MKAIILKNDNVLAVPRKQAKRKCMFLEICKDDEVRDKVAYWDNILFPEPIDEVKYEWVSKSNPNIHVFSVNEELKGIPNVKDYDRV